MLFWSLSVYVLYSYQIVSAFVEMHSYFPVRAYVGQFVSPLSSFPSLIIITIIVFDQVVLRLSVCFCVDFLLYASDRGSQMKS